MFAPLVAAFLVHQADPRLAHAIREDRSGWIYAHLEGSPKDIGYQYGMLLSKEIDDAQKALHEVLKERTGKDWSFFRDTTRTQFWSKVDPEYQQEIEGQAEGLKAKGLQYDQWDVLALNDYIEVEGYYLPWLAHKPATKTSCSAFIATGSQTADGKIVMAHNLWWDYEMGERFNVLLDIQPQKGHRLMMDAMCGFIHSGSDFAFNDAGMLISETTLPSITDFDPDGIPEFVRMRKATQYSENLGDFEKIMTTGNNGGYANTWLVGDTKTNEIGKLELGLKNVTFTRAKDGVFVGSNFPENPLLIEQETSGWDPNPSRNGCLARRERWNTLMHNNLGKVDAEMAKSFLGDTFNQIAGKKQDGTDFTLCGKAQGGGAVNSKVVTSDLAKEFKMWARMGVSDGTARKFPNRPSPLLRDMPSEPWELFTAHNG